MRPVGEVNAAGVFTHYVYAEPGLGGAPDFMVRSGTTYRLVKDHIGSVRMVVGVNGIVAQRIDYDAFGVVLSDTNPGFQPFGFAGGLYDADTSLVRFGARDYDPALGRWTAKDVVGFAGGQDNVYVYVGNDPVNLVDPTGKIGILASAGLGAAVGGITYLAVQGFTGNDISLAGFGAAVVGGGVGGALAPALLAQSAFVGLFGTKAAAGGTAAVLASSSGSMVQSALDPSQQFFSLSTATNAIAAGLVAGNVAKLLLRLRLTTLGTPISIYAKDSAEVLFSGGLSLHSGVATGVLMGSTGRE